MIVLKIGKEEIEIDPKWFPIKLFFNGKEYILRLTKNGKLILN